MNYNTCKLHYTVVAQAEAYLYFWRNKLYIKYKYESVKWFCLNKDTPEPKRPYFYYFQLDWKLRCHKYGKIQIFTVYLVLIGSGIDIPNLIILYKWSQYKLKLSINVRQIYTYLDYAYVVVVAIKIQHERALEKRVFIIKYRIHLDFWIVFIGKKSKRLLTVSEFLHSNWLCTFIVYFILVGLKV